MNRREVSHTLHYGTVGPYVERIARERINSREQRNFSPKQKIFSMEESEADDPLNQDHIDLIEGKQTSQAIIEHSVSFWEVRLKISPSCFATLSLALS